MQIEWVQSVLERLEGDQFSKLPVEHLGMSTEVVDQDLRGLLVFCEITALIEASGIR